MDSSLDLRWKIIDLNFKDNGLLESSLEVRFE